MASIKHNTDPVVRLSDVERVLHKLSSEDCLTAMVVEKLRCMAVRVIPPGMVSVEDVAKIANEVGMWDGEKTQFMYLLNELISIRALAQGAKDR